MLFIDWDTYNEISEETPVVDDHLEVGGKDFYVDRVDEDGVYLDMFELEILVEDPS